MGVKWTDEQQQVISHRGGDLLVSAAAGSGKTAVLVAHIISRIMDDEKPLDISRLLLVTFTEAAAAEMRDRLLRALDQALDAEPDNARIADQISRVPKAHIQTIDSFCMWLVRNNFHKLDIDPDFRIAEEGEGRLMRADVMDELLEEKYEEGSEEFLDLIDRYSRGKDDDAVSELILNLYYFSQSAPDPDRWLTECRLSVRAKVNVGSSHVENAGAEQGDGVHEKAEAGSSIVENAGAEQGDEANTKTGSLDAYPWAGMLSEMLHSRIKEQAGFLSSAAAMIADYDCLESLREVCEAESRSLLAICEEKSLDSVINSMRGFKTGRMTHRKIHDEEPEAKEFIKRMHKAFSDEWKELKKGFAFADPEEMCEVLREAGGPLSELIELTREFSRRYESEKKEKNLADFSDVEHWALGLLKDNEELARELSLQFDEIAIDEYQDSNLIQEEILTAVSGAGRGDRNMFMVGDVKQSIYKFRMAKPELFMGKYDRYPKHGDGYENVKNDSKPDEGGERLIELSRNFRTRASVLEVINHVFFRIMRRELGGVEYSKDCALYPGAEYPDYNEMNEAVDAARLPDSRIDPEGGQLSANRTEEDCVQPPESRIQDSVQEKTGFDSSSSSEEQLHASVPNGDRMTENRIYHKTCKDQASVELLLTVCGQGQERTETEARAVAEKIRQMTDPAEGLKLWDAANGEFRAAKYSDIAVLMRRVRGSAGIFEETLRGCGIPAVSRQSTGYFDAVEVQVLLNALAVIDNPAQDIPLASVMLSPMSSFDEDDLAIAVAWYKDQKRNSKNADVESKTDENILESRKPVIEGAGAFYAAVKEYAAEGDEPDLRNRLAAFLEKLSKLREYAIHNTIYDLIGEILRRTGYDLYLSALPAGNVRRLNIEMLKERAAAFEKTSYHGIFQFNRYIEKLRKYDVDFGEASTESEQDDVVRIMSIHKSKGLEYPVVFVCGCDGAFDNRDSSGTVILHDDLGAASDFIDIENSQRRKSLWKSFVADRIRRDNRGEELRVLYVAMTRAKEKLVLSGVLKERANKEEEELIADVRMKLTEAEELMEMTASDASGRSSEITAGKESGQLSAKKLPTWYIAGASSFLDWLLMAFGDARELAPVTIRRKEDLEEESLTRIGESGLLRSALAAIPPATTEALSRWEQQLDCGYEHEAATEMKGIWTVSELKEEAGIHDKALKKKRKKEEPIRDESDVHKSAGTEKTEDESEKTGIPKDGAVTQAGGALRGTVYHRILQNMPPAKDASAVRSWIKQNLPPDQAAMADPEDIAAFYRSRSGSLCLKPDVRRHTEQPFVLGIPESEFRESRRTGFADWKRKLTDADNLRYKDEEIILIQGIIDLYLEEDDGITLIDYKTDAASPKHILEAYEVQLRCYAMALARITGKPVKAIRIYSFHNRREIEVD